MKTPYRIVNSDDSNQASLFIYSYIGEDDYWGDVTPESVQADLDELEGQDLLVRIHSRGGSVPAGFVMMDALANYKGNVEFKIDGWALSMAAILPLIPNAKVSMSKTGRYMLHGPRIDAYGTEEDLRDSADLALGYKQQIADYLANKTGREVDSFVALLSDRQDHWYTAEEAKAEGFIDEIVEQEQVTACASIDDIKSFQSIPEEVKAELEENGENPDESDTSDTPLSDEEEQEDNADNSDEELEELEDVHEEEPPTPAKNDDGEADPLEVMDICNHYGHPEKAKQFVENKFSINQVKSTLAMLKAAGESSSLTPSYQQKTTESSWAQAHASAGAKQVK